MDIGLGVGGVDWTLVDGVAEERSEESPAATVDSFRDEATGCFAKERDVLWGGTGEACSGVLCVDDETSFRTPDTTSDSDDTSLFAVWLVPRCAVASSLASVAQVISGMTCAAMMASAEDV
jgi:hypothetical protein